jgi:multidrug efflux pump subunit AcrB
LTTADVAKTLVAATSSSRFIEPNFWRDPVSGNGFQIQVEIPQNRVRSMEDLRDLRLSGDGPPTLLRDVAKLQYGNTIGEVDRYDSQRVVSLTANLHGEFLGDAAKQIQQAIARVSKPPRGITVDVRGQIPPLEETVSGLRIGLLLSIVVIFLLLTFNFQSVRLALTVVTTVPAVLCGVVIMLFLTRTTLNVQSFMGSIMAIGVAVANAILFVTFSEFSRKDGAAAPEAALEGGRSRSRAILMTAAAMIFGMIPMALGLTSGGSETAPLARAVIGGLAAATISTMFILPSVYTILEGRSEAKSPSLSPYDPESRFYEKA